MIGGMWDTSQVTKLEHDFGKVPGKAVATVTAAVVKSGGSLRTVWRSNARATSGVHGIHYPLAITTEMKFGLGSIAAEVGPDPSKKQGGMSFEFGSVNQPPHLDGQKAADAVTPKFLKAMEAALVAGLAL